MEKGTEGAGEEMASREGTFEGLCERNREGWRNGQHEGHLGVSNIFLLFFYKMQLCHGIQTSLFFLDKILITTRHEARQVRQQWGGGQEQHYNIRSPHPSRPCGGERGIT